MPMACLAAPPLPPAECRILGVLLGTLCASMLCKHLAKMLNPIQRRPFSAGAPSWPLWNIMCGDRLAPRAQHGRGVPQAAAAIDALGAIQPREQWNPHSNPVRPVLMEDGNMVWLSTRELTPYSVLGQPITGQQFVDTERLTTDGSPEANWIRDTLDALRTCWAIPADDLYTWLHPPDDTDAQ